MSKKIQMIDLFAGCGGLTEGFEQSGHYRTLACVEWEEAPCRNLRHRLGHKWHYQTSDEMVLQFDIQRTTELLNGWDDKKYGVSRGLDDCVRKRGGRVDLIIGGPPCQAYSIAGRIRDEHGMRNDYRNYLFESYIKIVQHYQPKAVVFENVPGMLSARPGDGSRLAVDMVMEEFDKAGYACISDFKRAVIEFAQYGVPQYRKRVILLGLRKDQFRAQDTDEILNKFYEEILPSHQSDQVKTAGEAMAGLEPLYPLPECTKKKGRKQSHSFPEDDTIKNHLPRYCNPRDMQIFKLLANDRACGANRYASAQALKELYTSITGRVSNVHKYHVISPEEPSNTVPAHLYKDGLRHIHPDPEQQRSITVREAARLQTFPDDYKFLSGMSDNYKMIGNAVPPLFARILGESVYELLSRYG